MTRLRNRLIVAFLAATVLITTTLLDRSLRYATTDELDRLARTLETTGKQFYQRERAALKRDAQEQRVQPIHYGTGIQAEWPADVRAFWDSGEVERFGVSGPGGDRMKYVRRVGDGVE